MTTIVVVRKQGLATIGADTLVTYGDQLEGSDLVVNHSKLIQVADSWLAVTGHAAADLVLREILVRDVGHDEACRNSFEDVADIFKTFVDVHEHMKKHFFLRTDDEKDDEFESTHINALVANPRGIFGVCSRRSVFEYRKFYAFGSGEQYAMGAMHTVYPHLDDPAMIARAGLEAAAHFDSGTGTPLEFKTLRLAQA